MRIEEAIRQPHFKTSQQKAVINLMYTSNVIRNRHVAIFKPYGLAPQHYNVLRILRGGHPAPKSAGDIKAVMLDKSPDLTRIIDKLEKAEYVLRETCKGNRRKVDISITDTGLDLLEKLDPMMEAIHNNYNVLSDDEAEALSLLLDKIRGEEK
ncbi:MAG: MarR family winged helix-turn-helix transcriptional regulator [Bacteroidia bacterium]